MLNRSFYVVLILVQLVMVSSFSDVLFEQDYAGDVTIDNANKAQMRQGSLDFKFYKEEGNRLYVKDHEAGVKYLLDSTLLNSSSDSTVYVSFSLRNLNDTTKNKFAGLFLYQDGKEVFGLGNDFESENFSFWAAGGQATSIGDIPVAVDGNVHKIVMRIDFDPSGPEKIRVGLDPFCRRSEARQPDHIWTPYEGELSFDSLRLRSGNADCAWEFDEIRIGTDWASVTPSDDNPGAYVAALTANKQSPGHGEMIHDGVARFWSSSDAVSQALPSFSLESPRASTGSVSGSWTLKPQFGSAGHKKYAYIDIHAETDLYGTGEVTGSLLRNGYKIRLSNKDNFAFGKPDQLYQSHPWVLGVRPDGTAFGVIFDTPWMADLDLRSGILFTISDAAPPFPVMVIEGQDPMEVTLKLSALTGNVPMPPRWSLGYHQCRYSYYPEARMREVLDTFRAKRIPCDVLWFDIDYMDAFRIFTFDENHYPDPKGMNDYLHSMGFSSVWMIDPGIEGKPGFFVYDQGTKIDAWVKDAAGEVFRGKVWPEEECVFPDYTNPKVRKWWSGLYEDFMTTGIDGVWNDMNEPSVFNGPDGTMPLDNMHSGGGDLPPGPHEQYHNVWGLMMVKASRKGIQKANPDKRPFVLSRSNFLGGHRYAATWTGDNVASWEHMKWSVPMSLNLSLSGQPFNGPDIGGFVDNATPELWAHWIAMGALFPFSRAHSIKDSEDQEPWSFGPETERAARTALERRYRLMPYLYTLFRESHVNGAPVMQPVMFADPADLSLRMEDQAFLIGEDLMVVPQWAEDVQLPKGIWRDVSVVDGDLSADAYQCDLKVRGGAIVPMGPVVQSTREIGVNPPLTLLVVLDKQGKATGSVYEDEGEGYGYLKDEFRQSTFTAEKKGDRVVVKCSDQEGKLALEKRLVAVTVVDETGSHHGFGDICGDGGVGVMLTVTAE
jgi:alpha-glucosidase